MENLSSVFAEAGILMIVGMGFVFAFLSILIVAINILAKLSIKFPDPVPQVRRPKTVANVDSGAVSPSVVAAISTAVAQYRKNKIKN
ncbi:OadG family protein [Thalassomonas sp. M1454]|uniref:OadG family protein n=1 Tax=Thalassomonas sp. M1454 TaxID=2594477 RepID=UPI0011813356|nr:OadG family transporter subunit [Thalassomonas sp. M1454]TRX55796.1 oxaloacetate decarboxylase subunit gamma [Thalassomonas sp. M1454]